MIIKCVNKECENYNCELDDDLEICPACGEKPGQFESRNIKINLAVTGIVIGIAAVFMPYLFMQYMVIYWASYFVGFAGIPFGFLSKSKAAFITTILLFVSKFIWLLYNM